MSNQEIQKQNTDNAQIIESLVINGDLSKLNAQQKVTYYKTFCERLGLDPFSQPFKLMKFNGKEVMYCDRSGAQQLNKLHKISHDIKTREIVTGCYVVTAQASNAEGRHTESIGAVNIEGLKGEGLCNAMMKAETKAKRRATLDLLGLGMLDETEAETLSNALELKTPLSADDIPYAEPETIDLEIWKDQLAQCTDELAFRALFKSNKSTIDTNEELFKLFSIKATELGLTNGKKQQHANAA